MRFRRRRFAMARRRYGRRHFGRRRRHSFGRRLRIGYRM